MVFHRVFSFPEGMCLIAFSVGRGQPLINGMHGPTTNQDLFFGMTGWVVTIWKSYMARWKNTLINDGFTRENGYQFGGFSLAMFDCRRVNHVGTWKWPNTFCSRADPIHFFL